MSDWTARFDCERKQGPALIKLIEEYVKPEYSSWVFELGKKTEKPHIHGYLKINNPPWAPTASGDKSRQRKLKAIMEKLELYVPKAQCYSFTKMESLGYHRYISKDADYLKDTVPKDVKEEIKEKLLKGRREYKKKQEPIFPQLLDYVEKNQLNSFTLYNCQKNVIQFYRKVMKTLPNTKGQLLYLANRLYEAINKTSDEDILSVCFGINAPDTIDSKNEEILELKTLLTNLEHHHKKLLNEKKYFESLGETLSDSEDEKRQIL